MRMNPLQVTLLLNKILIFLMNIINTIYFYNKIEELFQVLFFTRVEPSASICSNIFFLYIWNNFLRKIYILFSIRKLII